MGATDQMLARYAAELEERQAFIDGLIEANGGKDLSDEQLGLVNETRSRMESVTAQMTPLLETRRLNATSAERVAEIAKYLTDAPAKPQDVEYRSAGAWINDYWKAQLGASDAEERLSVYNRAASHQTTSDNPGLLPTPIVEPVVNFIDAARPMVTWLGPRQIPSNQWTRPKVTQHTSVAQQPVGEKNELVSQKMVISKTAVTANTYGGYVNVSRQDIDWTSPQIMDLVIADLAANFGIVTEAALGAALLAGATAGLPVPTGPATAAALNASLWDAASKVYTAVKGQGRLAFFIAPDMLGLWGPLFAPVNPVTAISTGFSASDFGSGAMGAISGIPVYMSAGLPAGSNIVLSSVAAEVYEERIGSLQVTEPSVLGVQVAYAGYFTWWLAETGGIVKIAKTP
jgi:HK97 family phage major capsid protein